MFFRVAFDAVFFVVSNTRYDIAWRAKRVASYFRRAAELCLLLSFALPVQASPEQVESDHRRLNGLAAALGDGSVEDSSAAVRLLPDVLERFKEGAVALPMPLLTKIPVLIALAKDEKIDPDARRAAAEALGKMGETRAGIPVLIALAKDKKFDPDVRRAAAEALGKLGETKAAIPVLIAQAKDQNLLTYKRIDAAETLGKLGETKAAIPILIALAKDEKLDLGPRADAVDALGKLGETKAAIPVLIALAEDEKLHSLVRGAAAEALGKLGETKAVIPVLIALTKDEKLDPFVRRAAAEALGKLGETKAVIPVLIALAKDEKLDPGVRVAAAEAVGRLGETKVVIPVLIALAKDGKLDPFVRRVAAEAVGELGETKAAIPVLIALAKDGKLDPSVRGPAVDALGKLGETKAAIPVLIALARDEKLDPYHRIAAAEALGKMGKSALAVFELASLIRHTSFALDKLETLQPAGIAAVVALLAQTHLIPESAPKLRALAYLHSGGEAAQVALIRAMGHKDFPKGIPEKDRVQILRTIELGWNESREYLQTREWLAGKAALIANATTCGQETGRLKSLRKKLKDNNPTEAAAIQSAIDRCEASSWWWTTIGGLAGMGLFHLAFFMFVAFVLYPRYRWARVLLWHPFWGRKIGAYLHAMLVAVPSFRRRIFAPFSYSLKGEALLQRTDDAAYFPDSRVLMKHSGDLTLLRDAIPIISGQIVLEGDSGLGKSTFLIRLVQSADQQVAYLHARECGEGVEEAIIRVLPADIVRDKALLNSMLHIGAMALVIDGLNEVTPDVRAGISEFLRRMPQCNVLVATQPINWEPPTAAQVFVLQPLQHNDIETFLRMQKSKMAEDAARANVDYDQVTAAFLAQALDQATAVERESVARVLSNPMDLTTVARLLAHGVTPRLFQLREEQFRLMEQHYCKAMQQRAFPLSRFAEAVYQAVLAGALLEPKGFEQEIPFLLEHRMLLARDSGSGKGYIFRHDKIKAYFLYHSFQGEYIERQAEHFDDPRFRDVYFLMADILPLQEAQILREGLIQYAANSKDHSVSDEFIKLLRERARREEAVH